MNNQTKGPWLFKDREDDWSDCGIYSVAGEEVCTFGGGDLGDTFCGNPPDDADLRVMVAAPDMRGLLQEFYEFMAGIRFSRVSDDIRAEDLSLRAKELLQQIEGPEE